MSLVTNTANRSSSAFFSGGWLMVAALPYAQILGRGVFNVLGVAFLLWGMSSLLAKRPKMNGPLLMYWSLMTASFTASALNAEDSKVAFDRLVNFTLYGLVAWPVMAALRDESDLRRLVDAFALAGLLSIFTLFGLYAVRFNEPGFVPELHMHEDNLPFLLPLVLCALATRTSWSQRNIIATGLIILTTAYVILSNGRAALFGLVVGLCSYGVLVVQVRKRTLAAIAIAIVCAAFLIRGAHFYRNADIHGDLGQAINAVSSYRTELWSNAFNYPPANIWLGSGMGNIPDQVLTIHGEQSATLKHLHSFLFDCGYENGVIGLAALLAWLGSGLRQSFRRWRSSARLEQQCAGAVISSSLAIAATALLSYSYASKQFASYLFILLAAGSFRMGAVIFVHIPKASGSSLTDILRRRCASITAPESHRYIGNPDDIANLRQLPRRSRANIRLLVGQFPFGLHTALPNQQARYVTMLREPIDRVVSLYNYASVTPGHYLYDAIVKDGLTLETILQSGNYPEFYNLQTIFIAGPDPETSQMDGTLRLERAKRNLIDNFSAFGLTERFEESLVLIKLAFNWSIEDVILVENLNVTPSRPATSAIPPRVIDLIRDRNRADLALYEFARTHFDQRIGALGQVFQSDLETLRRLTEQARLQVVRRFAT